MPQRGSAMNKVRALLVAQLERCVTGLREGGARDSTVHAARKELKRARAVLRLLRKSLGRHGYRRLNLALRDAARPLAGVRDAKAMMKAFASVRSAESSGGERTFGLCVSRALHRDWRESRRRFPSLGGVCGSIEQVRRQIARVRSADLDRTTAGSGVARVYKAGQRAYVEARRRPNDEHLHELRKQAKYLFNQIDSLARITGVPSFSRLSGGRFKAIRKQSDRLSECLGDDHDLSVLQRKMDQISSAAGLSLDSPSVAPWTKRILKQRAALQRDARSIGKRLYSRRAADLQAKIDG